MVSHILKMKLCQERLVGAQVAIARPVQLITSRAGCRRVRGPTLRAFQSQGLINGAIQLWRVVASLVTPSIVTQAIGSATRAVRLDAHGLQL